MSACFVIVSWACYFCSVMTQAFYMKKNSGGFEIGDGAEKGQVPNDWLYMKEHERRTYSLFFKTFYSFIHFQRKGGKETSICGCLSQAPNWGSDLQPRCVPWLGIEQATLWFAGWHSSHWATPARAWNFLLSAVWQDFLNLREMNQLNWPTVYHDVYNRHAYGASAVFL